MTLFSYASLASSLSQSLEKHHTLSPSLEMLEEALPRYLDVTDIAYAEKLINGDGQAPDWHFVEVYHGAFGYMDLYDEMYSATSLSHALSFVINAIDEVHQYPDSISINKSNIEFRKLGKLLYKVGSIQFEKVDEFTCANVTKAFKGLKYEGADRQIQVRLNGLKGLEDLEIEEFEASGEKPVRHQLIPMVENFPIFIREMLKEEFNIDIKLSIALEVAANTFGVNDWNRFKALANKNIRLLTTPIALESHLNDSEYPEYTYYLNNSDGVTGFMKMINSRMDKETKTLQFHGSSYKKQCILLYAEDEKDNEIKIDSTKEIKPIEEYLKLTQKFDGMALDEVVNGLNSLLSNKLDGSNERLSERTLIVNKKLITYRMGNASRSASIRIENINEYGDVTKDGPPETVSPSEIWIGSKKAYGQTDIILRSNYKEWSLGEMSDKDRSRLEAILGLTNKAA